MPVVSVIVPNYNHQKYLAQRIESVLAQSFTDFEVIILDDASTDDSRRLIETYRQKNDKITNIIYNEENSGSTFRQWQKGISASKGEFIWIAESDDWCEPVFLAEMLQGMINNDEVVIAHCQSMVVGEHGQILDVVRAEKFFECVDSSRFLNENMLPYNSIYNASMAVFRKSAYLKISSRFTEMKYCGDWLFWSEIANQGKVNMNGRILNYYRKHSADVTTKSVKTGAVFIESQQIFNFIIEKTGFQTKSKSYIYDFRIREYAKNRKFFETPAIQKQVLLSLKAIDPDFTLHFAKFRLKKFLSRFLTIK